MYVSIWDSFDTPEALKILFNFKLFGHSLFLSVKWRVSSGRSKIFLFTARQMLAETLLTSRPLLIFLEANSPQRLLSVANLVLGLEISNPISSLKIRSM
jgi:hypothetical protein